VSRTSGEESESEQPSYHIPHKEATLEEVVPVTSAELTGPKQWSWSFLAANTKVTAHEDFKIALIIRIYFDRNMIYIYIVMLLRNYITNR